MFSAHSVSATLSVCEGGCGPRGLLGSGEAALGRSVPRTLASAAGLVSLGHGGTVRAGLELGAKPSLVAGRPGNPHCGASLWH